MSTPKQLNLNVKLDESISLSNFIKCKSTELLLKRLKDFSEDASISDFLYLWGNRGVGKNYLIQAVNQEYLRKGKTSAFLTFSNHQKLSPNMLEGLENLDVIFVEDIDLIVKSYEWEIAFFNLINNCLVNNTKTLISSRMVAKNLDIDLKDLKSRLTAFPAVEVPEISEQEKVSALKEASSRRGLVLEGNVLSYILNHTSRSLSGLLNLLSELDTYSLQKQRKLSINLVKGLLETRDNSPDKERKHL